jgi:hypothetical protein
MELSEQPLAVKNVVQFGLYVASMHIGLSANAWLSEWGTTRGASTLSRYFWPVRLPSRTYNSDLKSKEKQPQTVHPKWSCDQSNRAWRWRNVNCGRFMGRRARIPWWWRRLITVRVLMWPPNAKFRLLTDFVCLYNYEFWLSLCKIVRSSVILLLPLFTTKCTSCTERPLPRPSGYEPVLSRLRFARFTCTWTVSNIPRLTKTLHQSYNDGMVNPEVVCHPSMAKTTGMHANSLPPFWYG